MRNTRNKYIPIPFCHHLYLSATFKQCFTEFEVTELSFHIAYMWTPHVLFDCRQVKMMKKGNRNIKNIFIMLQRGTNIMANQVKTTIQNYFEKSVVWKFDIWGSSLVVFLRVVCRGITKNRNKPLWLNVCMMIIVNFHSTIIDELKKNIFLTFDHCRIRFSVYHQWLNIFRNFHSFPVVDWFCLFI